MSGVIYALLCYVWMMGQFASLKTLFIEAGFIGFMLLWLAVGFCEPFGIVIANMAHLLGLISGCVISVFDVKLLRVS
ncbi:rhomboid family intramembrane serine protease [Candidatus Enterovibrio altilux]|uniref:rhomboid family intramembrane serine protease n=1 Tax=Candidatus Enterovibrio altilux TaxID=1927128 RepID=UPI001CC24284|nr:rhomboid family intramembrane serine protease [Candidatus Enterovibrio luxaltus]